MRRNIKSFTLIELLVVISIIGLISSIVLVGFNLPEKKLKARISKSLSFSQSLQNVLGSEAVGIWTFDGDTGNTVKDISGLGNDGTINNGTSFRTDTPFVLIGSGQGKQSIEFDGANDFIDMGNRSNVFDFASAPLTIEAWIKPSQDGAGTIVSKNCGGSTPRWILDRAGGANLNKIRFFGSGTNPDEIFSTKTTPSGEWSHIVAVWDGSVMVFYINGDSAGTTSRAGNHSLCSNDPLSVGGRIWGGNFGTFPGLLDDIRIYVRVLSGAEIQKHYAQGLEKLKLAKE